MRYLLMKIGVCLLSIILLSFLPAALRQEGVNSDLYKGMLITLLTLYINGLIDLPEKSGKKKDEAIEILFDDILTDVISNTVVEDVYIGKDNHKTLQKRVLNNTCKDELEKLDIEELKKYIRDKVSLCKKLSSLISDVSYSDITKLKMSRLLEADNKKALDRFGIGIFTKYMHWHKHVDKLCAAYWYYCYYILSRNIGCIGNTTEVRNKLINDISLFYEIQAEFIMDIICYMYATVEVNPIICRARRCRKTAYNINKGLKEKYKAFGFQNVKDLRTIETILEYVEQKIEESENKHV